MLLALTTSSRQATAQQDTPVATAPAESITVIVREVPPFAMRDDLGNWEGLSVDLWRAVARRLGLEFEWQEAALDDTIEMVRNADADVAVAAISVTSAREEFLDFSHPYYVTGLAPAFSARTSSPWAVALARFFSAEFLTAVGSLVLVLFAAGAAVWLFEHNANSEQFDGDVRRGLGDGFWWSAVTMTTVGYGDKAPRTLGGRIVALVWMFISLIIIASFTASIAASLTASELGENALRDRPLSDMSVGVLAESVAAEFATNRGARVLEFDSVPAAIDALSRGDVDTVLHDSPILKHQIRASGADVDVVDRILVRDDYAFAFPASTALRNDVNIALLSVLYEPEWQDIRARYLGEVGSALD